MSNDVDILAPDSAVLYAVRREYRTTMNAIETEEFRVKRLNNELASAVKNLAIQRERCSELLWFATSMGWDTKDWMPNASE